MSDYDFIELSYACSSVEAQETFWAEYFGGEAIFRGRLMGQPFARMMVCGVSLVFREDPDFVAPAGPGEELAYRNHIGLRVDDLDAAIAELEAKGAEFTLTPAKVRELQQARRDPDDAALIETTFIAPPLTRARIDAGEFVRDVAILVGPDNLWVELNQITEPDDTRWYPGS